MLRIVDVEGKQVPDFVCFNLDNPRERLSTNNSRLIQKRWLLTTVERQARQAAEIRHAERDEQNHEPGQQRQGHAAALVRQQPAGQLPPRRPVALRKGHPAHDGLVAERRHGQESRTLMRSRSRCTSSIRA